MKQVGKNNMKPIIGITTSPVKAEDRVALNCEYIRAVRMAGGIPVFLYGESSDAEALSERLDGVLFSGGGDIDPARYGRANMGSGEPDPQRDAFELALFSAARKKNLPILGICRGCQLIQCAMGGTLIQDIPSALGIPHPLCVDVIHTVNRMDGTFLSGLFPEEFMVNSTHHQCVEAPAPGLRVCAAAENGKIIEAVEAADGSPIWGVQWHPERLVKNDAMMGIFRLLINTCG